MQNFQQVISRCRLDHALKRTIATGRAHSKRFMFNTTGDVELVDGVPYVTLCYHSRPYFEARPDAFRVQVPRASPTTMKRVRSACPYPIRGRNRHDTHLVVYPSRSLRLILTTPNIFLRWSQWIPWPTWEDLERMNTLWTYEDEWAKQRKEINSRKRGYDPIAGGEPPEWYRTLTS